MTENPYQPPKSDQPPIGIVSGNREDLRAVAVYQKGIIVCILIYVLAVLGQFLIPVELRIFLGLGVLFVGFVGTVFVLLLAVKVYDLIGGILLGILTLVPCIGLICLLIVNAKATSTLKENGIHVGLMGANLSDPNF